MNDGPDGAGFSGLYKVAALRIRRELEGAAASPGVGIAIGAPLPARIGERAVNGTRSALCLGPDEWLVEAPEAEGGALAVEKSDSEGTRVVLRLPIAE